MIYDCDTLGEYKELISENERVIVMFGADQDTMSKMMAPMYEELSEAHNDITFGKVDIAKNPEIRNEAQISNIPSFRFFNKGEMNKELSETKNAALPDLIAKFKAQ